MWAWAFCGEKTREHENWLNALFFENTEVGLDTSGKSEGKTARRSQQWLTGC
jgi:hypothetical protein